MISSMSLNLNLIDDRQGRMPRDEALAWSARGSPWFTPQNGPVSIQTPATFSRWFGGGWRSIQYVHRVFISDSKLLSHQCGFIKQGIAFVRCHLVACLDSWQYGQSRRLASNIAHTDRQSPRASDARYFANGSVGAAGCANIEVEICGHGG